MSISSLIQMARAFPVLVSSAFVSLVTSQPLPADLLHNIHQAVANGTPAFVIPPGQYNFSAYPFLQFTLDNPQNFDMSGYGATLIFSPTQGISLTNAVNTSFRGVAVDYSPLAFTQGAISNISYSPGTEYNFLVYDLMLDPGFPSIEYLMSVAAGLGSDVERGEGASEGRAAEGGATQGRAPPPAPIPYAKSYFYNSSTRLLYHAQVETSSVLHNYSSLGQPGQYRVYTHITSDLQGWHPPTSDEGGDGLTLNTMSISPGPAVQCQNCSLCLFEDVTIYSSRGMGYVEVSGVGSNVLRRWRSIRPPPDSGLQPQGRLLSTTIDGVHSTSVARGLTLIDSEIGFSGDDAFAVHCELGIGWGVPTSMDPAVSTSTEEDAHGTAIGPAAGQSLWIIDTGGPDARTVASARPGDELQFFALNNTMDPYGTAVVYAVSVVQNATLQDEAAQATADIQKLLNMTIRPLSAAETLLIRVDFSTPVPALATGRYSSLVQYSERCGRGTQVINTTLHDSSGGMRLKGVDVTVLNCTVARAYGMRMVPEPFWTQSISFNVSIINNMLINTGDAPAAPVPIEYYNDTCTGLVMEGNTMLPE